MKRHIYLLVLLFFVNLGVSAQIQRHFFDFELGVTSMSKVFNYFKNQGNDVYQPHNDALMVAKVRFGGNSWGYAIFTFFNDKLVEVIFSESDERSSKEMIETLWDTFNTRFYNKYSEYYDISISTENTKFFFDSNTALMIGFYNNKTETSLMIRYYDNKLHDAKSKSEEDEL